MIFITVGTHEQPFDRLLKCIDKMVEDGLITEEIVCQKGFTDYEPKNYKAEKLISYEEMQENIKKARIVITHGGPASFIAPLTIGKIPIVVPRQKKYNEHVNDHQYDFAKEVEKRMGNIIVANTDDEIINSINKYDKIIKKIKIANNSNNISFCNKLNDIICNLLDGVEDEKK